MAAAGTCPSNVSNIIGVQLTSIMNVLYFSKKLVGAQGATPLHCILHRHELALLTRSAGMAEGANELLCMAMDGGGC